MNLLRRVELLVVVDCKDDDYDRLLFAISLVTDEQ
jgi:hypothetical protein